MVERVDHVEVLEQESALSGDGAALANENEPAQPAGEGHHGEGHHAPSGEPAHPPVARRGGTKVHSTPDIWKRLEPCSVFKMRLNFNDHRFTCDTKAEKDPRWIDIYGQKTYSKGFKLTRDWQSALRKVHQWRWEKFDLFPGRSWIVGIS